MEFVIYQYTHLDDTICYYNEMCMRPALGFVAFNNVISNLVYITLGLLWMFFVWLNSFAASKISETVGLGRDFSLYYCMVRLHFAVWCSREVGRSDGLRGHFLGTLPYLSIAR